MSHSDEDRRTPVTYVARFQRLGPVLMIVLGIAIPIGVVWVLRGRNTGASGFVYALFGLLAFLALTGLGLARLGRGKRNGWIALSIDNDGISFGPRSGGPVRFSWDDVSAFVVFSRRTDFLRGVVKCIGVRLHPCAPDSPESYLAELRRTRSRPDLTDEERARLGAIPDRPPELDLEMAVSFHIEARGWGFTRARLKEAVRAHAPAVPIAEYPADRYWSLVGWRADRERLQQVRENAELRGW
jgi:hypothetical protein